jgi:cadmium resistance protein CadD (predicted permease)
MIAEMKLKVMDASAVLLGAISFIEVFDVGVRICSGLGALILIYLGARHHIAKTRRENEQSENLKIERQIKEQELYDIIESNKKKHG